MSIETIKPFYVILFDLKEDFSSTSHNIIYHVLTRYISDTVKHINNLYNKISGSVIDPNNRAFERLTYM